MKLFDSLEIHKGEVVVLGARPAMGKTCLAIQIAQESAIDHKQNVMFISFETNRNMLIQRIISQRIEVEFDRLKHWKDPQKMQEEGNVNGEEYQRLVHVLQELEDSPLRLMDFCEWRDIYGDWESFYSEALDHSDFLTKDLIVFDYLQLINTVPKETRNIELYNILVKMKRLALETDTCIFVTSQLNRNVEERPGHRPLLSDLRESGNIEEIADKILFLLRREYYDHQDKPGIAGLLVSKDRIGKTHSINLVFRAPFCHFCLFNPEDYL